MAKTKAKAKIEEAGPLDAAGRVWPFENITPTVGPPWTGGPTITVSELEELRLRAGRQDYKNVIAALQAEGSITVVPDP